MSDAPQVALFPCARGCGQFVEVDTLTLEGMARDRLPFVFAHSPSCPGQTEPVEEIPDRWFRVQILVLEVGDHFDPATGITETVQALKATPGVLDVMGGAGHTFPAANVGEAVSGPMTNWLNEAWPKMQEEVMVAEIPEPSADFTPEARLSDIAERSGLILP